MTVKHKRIAVAMSGGVDSSVAAALLKQAGAEVIGLFVKTWTPEPNDGTTCTWVADRRDALRVAAKLQIPLLTIDLEDDYRQRVVKSLVNGYAAGETPNPDVLCNRYIKFGRLVKIAKKLGATALATGHYCRVVLQTNEEEFRILRGVDENKDQSYFLWDIHAETLPFIQFPIGHLHKPEVRNLAKKFDLPVADKKDSQGICFLGKTDLTTFLGRHLPTHPGLLFDFESDQPIGTHHGVELMTIGQRHGVGRIDSKSSEETGRYVVKKSIQENKVWMGEKSALMKKQLIVFEANWLVNEIEKQLAKGEEVELECQIRYRGEAQMAKLKIIQHGEILVKFDSQVFAPAPGQSVVFYAGNQLLGGAMIKRVEN